MPNYTALVTVLAVLFYFSTSVGVARARRKFGVPAPAMSGQPDFDRAFRVQMNTLEWMPIFLPLLWLFAIYVTDIGAAVLGLIWIAGRFFTWCVIRRPPRTQPGFCRAGAVCGVLLVGARVDGRQTSAWRLRMAVEEYHHGPAATDRLCRRLA